MNAITRAEVEHVAQLAHLALNEEQLDLFTGQLATVVNYLGRLGEVDTAHVEPTVHLVPVKNVMRSDVPHQSWPQERVLTNAVVKQDGYFHAPRILDVE